MPPQPIKDNHDVHERTPDSQQITQDKPSPPQQQSQRPRDTSWVTAFLDTTFRAVYKNKNTHIDKDLLKKLNIRVVELSFRTGATKRGEQFIQPLPPQEMEVLLSRTKPFDNTGVRSDFVREETIKEQERPPQEEARAVWRLIDTCLTRTHDVRGYGQAISPDFTSWRFYASSFPRLHRVSNINCYGHKNLNVEWSVTSVVQPCLPGEDKWFHDKRRDEMMVEPPLDYSKPHFTCFLTNHNDISGDNLTTAEVVTALYIAVDQALKPIGQMNRFFPVTVICGSSRTIRIVQGVLDSKTQSFELRVTRPIHFPNGARANWEEFLCLLGWFIGHPVGNTT